MSRQSPKVTLTLPLAVRAKLDALAAQDATEQGRESPNRSATVAALVLGEEKRRERRAGRKSAEDEERG